MKTYIKRWELGSEPHKITYWFTTNPEAAAFWATEEHAEQDCCLMMRHQIQVRSHQNQIHVCRELRPERREDGKFVIARDLPFEPADK